VRHGEAEHNVVDDAVVFARRRDTTLVDPRLTQKGKAQADAAAAALAAQLAKHFDDQPGAIVSSTLRRALQTAELAVLPVAAAGATLLAIDLACEIQYGDIWNEPRSTDSVAAEWPHWSIEPSKPWLDCGSFPPLETADKMVARAEAVWDRLAELRSPVVVLVSHGCFLQFFARRLSLASSELEAVDCSYFSNAEVRRVRLPPPDGRRLKWVELVNELTSVKRQPSPQDIDFWNRYSKRVDAINRAGPGCGPSWAQKEWRYARHDEDFDVEL